MPGPLTPLAEARAALLDGVIACAEPESVPLDAALGRVLAAAQLARIDVPPADNSAMDGFAVRAADAAMTLPVAQRVAAGDVGAALAPGTVARIFTGAPIPAGSDAVVMQEDVLLVGSRAQLPENIATGQHVRRRGQDCRQDDLLLEAGRRLRPQDIGLLASQGIGELQVRRRLRVALLSTGNELREPGSGELPAGAIYNSNRPMLAGLLRCLGFEVLDLGIIRDEREATESALREAAESADAVLSCGGVSVGEADYVRDAVAALGSIDLWRIAIKPGKPFAFGRVSEVPFIGLPGNPSSAFVTFLLLARPYLAALQGRSDLPSAALPAHADFDVPKPGSREEFLRVQTRLQEGALWATPYANQSSGVLRSVSASDALAVVPLGRSLSRGDPVEILNLDGLLF